MIRRPTRPKTAALAATALALLAQLTMLVGSVSAITLPDPCMISPTECATITIKLNGNGTGAYGTLSGHGQLVDWVIDCRRMADTTYGTCSHRWWVGAGNTKTIYLTVDPADQNKSCPTIITCTSNAVEKQVILEPDRLPYVLSANFVLDHPETLSVSTSIAGAGSIASTPIGIDCPPDCSSDYNYATDLGIYLHVNDGYVFRGWSLGPCRGQGTECHFMIGVDTPIVAILEPDTPVATPEPTPDPTPKPTAKPTATPKPAMTSKPTVTPAPGASTGPAATPPASAEPAPSAEPTQAAPVATSSTAATAAAPDATAPDDNAAPASSAPGAGTVTGGNTGTPTGTGAGGISQDTTAIVLAIVLAGLLVAFGIVVSQRRRTADGAPARAG